MFSEWTRQCLADWVSVKHPFLFERMQILAERLCLHREIIASAAIPATVQFARNSFIGDSNGPYFYGKPWWEVEVACLPKLHRPGEWSAGKWIVDMWNWSKIEKWCFACTLEDINLSINNYQLLTSKWLLVPKWHLLKHVSFSSRAQGVLCRQSLLIQSDKPCIV